MDFNINIYMKSLKSVKFKISLYGGEKKNSQFREKK